LGADENLSVLSDFPYSSELTPADVDFVTFHQLSTRSNIFISYKPILGRSYFNGNSEEVAKLFKDSISQTFKEKIDREIIKGLSDVDLDKSVIGDRQFYEIKYKVTRNLDEEREAYIFLHISDDIKSLYMFCFSTLASSEIEKNQPFQDFITTISGFEPNWLSPYDEILYRNYAKSWMFRLGGTFIEAELAKAIVDESIEELKDAVALKPDAWEPHYLLAEQYGEKYFLGSHVEYMSVSGGKKQEVLAPTFSSFPVNAEAAIKEYKYLIELNPNFNKASKWTLIRLQLESASKPNLEDVYRGIAKSFASIEKYDEAIFYLEEGIKKIHSAKYLKGDLRGLYDKRARKNVKEGNYDLALQDYKKILSKENSTFAIIAYREEVAKIYIQKGMINEAIEEYSKALETAKKEGWSSSINEIENKIKELQN
jgi:tetratricopeptide (TPR) repeat protein